VKLLKKIYYLRKILIFNKVIFFFRLLNYSFYDFKNYFRNSSISNSFKNPNALKALIQIEFHRLEKGLSLRKMKKTFGKEVVNRLMYFINIYLSNFKYDQHFFSMILDGLKEYLNRTKHDQKFHLKVKEFNNKLIKLKKLNLKTSGGTKIANNKSYLKYAKLLQFISNRHSCRNFIKNNKKISKRIFENAKALASLSPSVCNRQTCNFKIIEKNKISKVLKLQSGGFGFAENANSILVIYSDLNKFDGANEKNQPYFETGTFTLNLVYAFQSQGLSTCYLNWCSNPKKDQELKKIINLKKNNIIGTLLAVGYSPKEYRVAFSNKFC